jgi:hypothetical protein
MVDTGRGASAQRGQISQNVELEMTVPTALS